MEFADLVRRRRTVRRFENTPVGREVLEKIARLAQRTPPAAPGRSLTELEARLAAAR
jgi:nitroreductase